MWFTGACRKSRTVILKIYIEKVIRLPISDFGMPVFHIKRKWILIAILLPLLVKGSYLLFFQGASVISLVGYIIVTGVAFGMNQHTDS